MKKGKTDKVMDDLDILKLIIEGGDAEIIKMKEYINKLQAMLRARKVANKVLERHIDDDLSNFDHEIE